MPSDRRFHPLTVLFALAGQLRAFLVPILLATFTAQSRGRGAETWFLIFLIPGLVAAIGRYWFSTYRYDETELVVRTGIFFKNERHVPYTRIQSVDAVQNVMHRFFGVVDVQVQTGTGGEAEATLSVLPLSALIEMRERVFEGKRAVGAAESASDAGAIPADTAAPALVAEPARTILHLSPRELALSGVLDNRGWVVIGAVTGLAAESGLFERIESWMPLPDTWSGMVPIGIAVAVGLFVVSPLLSLVWATIRLYGFSLSQRGADLCVEYGAFTRVTATIPLRRVQAVKIARGLGHLWTGRAAVRVETAGGGTSAKGGGSEREWIAPILPMAELDSLVRQILPDVSLETVEWSPVAGRALLRRARRSSMVAFALGLATIPWAGWWAAAITPALVVLGIFLARQYVRGLGWARTDHAMYFRSGWLRRNITIVPLPKIQCVQLVESPFDRRHAMASLSVDTAGAGAHPIRVPYLMHAVADSMRMDLAAHAATTEYRW